MTQIDSARAGITTPQMASVAAAENRDPEYIRSGVAEGTIVVPANRLRETSSVCGIGTGLRTKVNANIGSSPDRAVVDEELAKLHAACDAGADAVMDLSIGGDTDLIRRSILDSSNVPVGSVPLYDAAVKAVESGKSVVNMTAAEMIAAFEKHARDGMDFFVVHCGVTRESVGRLRTEGRLAKIVSRGGAFAVEWMVHNEAENPLYDRFDEILDVAKEYDVTLSLGDGLRPGCLADATDRCQIQELIIQGELADRARAAGVQVMIEGPGHVPLDQIAMNIQLQKRICKGAPFYVLGPLVTDVALGYDHISAAIGGAVAAAAGADFLCYVTPAEHLALPSVQDVKEGVIAARIAAHAGDIAKGIPGAREWDDSIAAHRRARRWDEQMRLAIDPETARQYRSGNMPVMDDVCTMCGKYCSMKGIEEFL
jgi:phosphomethylpyrimidine synthase